MKTTKHPLDTPRPANRPPVGPLIGCEHPYPHVSDGDTARVLFYMNESGAYEGNKNRTQAVADAKEIAHRYNTYEELVKALEFYENKKNWEEIETGIGMYPGDAVDYGSKARKALAKANKIN